MNEREHRQVLYTVNPVAGESSAGAVSRLERISALVRETQPAEGTVPSASNRNLWTRSLDAFLRGLRRYVPPLHYVAYHLTAVTLFLYGRLLAVTVRLVTAGEQRWPNLPKPVVLALWHGDAPALITAFAARRPTGTMGIMVARDPRGDSLALLCRMLGLETVRGDNEEKGWEALAKLATLIERGGSVVITADGTGPARVVKVGALALASATGAPIIALGANCQPALMQSRKWDNARNPLPFGRVSVFMGSAKKIPVINNHRALEEERAWLQSALEEANAAAARSVQS